ncbi:hypothetical protein HYW30_00780, partial [Candidatus Azambacteria bacterium]|nr:hypothetical protein [Candidatus Azambacteria bacterium]
ATQEVKIRAKELREAIKRYASAATWAGQLEGPTGAVALKTLDFNLIEAFGTERDRIGALSSLASAHYTLWGNKTAHLALGKEKHRKPLEEEARGALRKARELMAEALRLAGRKRTTQGMWAVWGSILNSERKYREAARAYREGLKDSKLKWHARAILLAGLAAPLARLKKFHEVEKAFEEALKLCGSKAHPNTVRVWRKYGNYVRAMGERNVGTKYLRDALKMARALGLEDQITKLQADLKG